MVAGRIASLTGPMFEQTAFIARGDEFPDALAASPPAYYNRFPILLTRPDSLPPSTLAALSGLDIETAAVAGGTGAVSDAVKAAIDTRLVSNGGAASDRWAGPTRYETAVEVAKGATDKHWAGRGFVGLAVGDNFPDALCGGAAAGREFGLVLLVRPASLPTAAGGFVDGSGDGIGWVEAFGGTAVVSDAVGNDVVGRAQ
jgi:putative cell wall-binding protein